MDDETGAENYATLVALVSEKKLFIHLVQDLFLNYILEMELT